MLVVELAVSDNSGNVKRYIHNDKYMKKWYSLLNLFGYWTLNMYYYFVNCKLGICTCYKMQT